ncbi:MAG: hypothetical protein LBC34_01115 [Rickettsiales bacterium]|jgi:predicted  nucleic acid-binding Zn-ribbon protein|nr:hypothetical protein [Rickettsiales bacterium]
MLTNFLTLKEILAELKRKNSIAVLRKYCQDEWKFYDLLRDLTNDEDFKQACIDKSFNESCKKDLDHYIELANQAKKAVSKYFERKDTELQAYHTEANDADRVLNINLTNHDGNEPIRISDILQQEKNISELNVYCDKKHDIYAYRKNKKRYYEFKEGAYYEMTSTWPATDKSGKIFMCTMVMNVSNDGITEILKFDGRDFESPSKEFWELIELNKELYIQGLSLYDAVKALLEKNKTAPLPDVVPVADNNLQNNESIGVDQGKELDRQGLENNADNSPISPTNSNASTQTEVDSLQVTTQMGIDSRPIATQPKVSLQHAETQTEVTTQYVEVQTETDSQPIATQQEIKELNKQRNDLQNEFRKEGQKNIELQANLAQKNEELASISANLQEKTQELENVYKEKEDLKKKMEVANAEKEELISKLQEELNQLKEKNYKLEDENDQLECSNKKLEKEKEQLLQKISGLKEALLSLEGEKQKLIDSLESAKAEKEGANKKLTEAEQRIEQLDKQNNNLQNKLAVEEKKHEKLQAELKQKDEELAKLQEIVQELESVYEKKEKMEKDLKVVNAKKEKLEDELKQFEEEAEQVEYMMNKKEEYITNLKFQMQNLESEYNTRLKSRKQEIKEPMWKIKELTNELKLKDEQVKKQGKQLRQEIEEEIMNEYGPKLELKFKEYENKIEMLEERNKEREEMFKKLQKIVADKVQKIENLESELQNKKEGEVFPNDPDNVPLKKKKLPRSLSIDSGYNSDKESYNNRCHSPLSFVSNPVQVNNAYTGQSERSNYSSIYP